jgi:hypothetical protein
MAKAALPNEADHARSGSLKDLSVHVRRPEANEGMDVN